MAFKFSQVLLPPTNQTILVYVANQISTESQNGTNDFDINFSSHYGDITWALWHVKSLATPLFVQQRIHADNKANIKAYIVRASDLESVPMAWRHHVLLWVGYTITRLRLVFTSSHLGKANICICA